MKKKIIAMLAAMMCLASSSLSYSSVAIAANSLNSNDIAEVKITSSDLKECNLVTESKNDGCWINFDLVSGAFAMSGNNHQSFSIIGSFERKDNDLYLYPENGSAEFYILHREEDHFVSQSDEIGVQLKAGLVFYADNDAFWEILLDWTLSGNEPSNTGETAEQNTSFIMGDVNDDDTFEDAECAMTVTVSEINGETLLVKSSDGKGEFLTLSTKYLDSSIQPKVGMKLEVVYTGGILQTYPCQFGNVKKVSVVSDNTTLMGDVNADGEFGIADVILLQKWLLAVPDTHLANWKAADFCEDNKLDVFDLTLMKRALLENIQDPVEPPADQIAPLGFKTADDAIKEIIQSDLSEIEGYAQMFERFRNDGFIYHFTDAENAVTLQEDRTNAAVWLMPYDYFEDTGILYHVAYQGKDYQVYYYFNDSAFPESDLWDYMEQRLHTENINVVDEKYGIVEHSNGGHPVVSAYFAIDDTHYCKVKTFEPEDALKDFLQVLNHDKLDIADNSIDDPVVPMTAQPIGYKDMESAIEAIHNNDVNAYPEQYYDNYRKMFDRFSEDGYIYHFADAENAIALREDHPNAAIWLMPYANYEDTGILYHVVYQCKNYQVYYYFNDPAYTVSDLWEYIEQRLGIKNFNVVDEKYGIVDNSNGEQSVVSAFFAIDDTHYCKVKTFEQEDALIDFLQVLNYEKLDIADNSEVFVPVNSSDTDLDKSAIAGKIFAYEKEGAGGYCTLSFNENGRFLYSPGKLSSYMDGGDWKIDGDTVSLIGMENKTIYLKITDDTLVYIAEGSDEFPYMDIKDGEKFVIYRPEISADKFQLNSRYSEYGLGDPKVELDLIVSELPEFCYVEDVRLYDEDDNFIGMMSPAMDADIWNYLVDCHVTEECSKKYYTLTKIRCGEKTYLDDVRSEITVNFKVAPAP